MSFQDYDVLWIQSIPSIATIYYKKYLTQTHVLTCPDETQLPRKIARQILELINSETDKKVAVHFMSSMSDTKRETIYKFIKKSKPQLSSHCLSIPTNLFQTHLLKGWSTGINNEEWKTVCAVEYDPEAFVPFTPPTIKQSSSTHLEFSEKEFLLSKKIFSKKALLVDMTMDMVTFHHEKGIFFNRGVENSIKGWIKAAEQSCLNRTLIWILNEKTLYGESVYSVIQDKRSALLEKYRETLFSSIQAFATTTPVYCYLIDCCTTYQYSLSNCLAQIQHRHHLCLSKSILLKRQNDKDLDPRHVFEMKSIYLDSIPIHSQSKWESIFLKFFSEMEQHGQDDMNYISPNLLGIENLVDDYITPLLSQSYTDTLTMTEPIGYDASLHTVSAQSSQVFKDWIETIVKEAENDQDIVDTPVVVPNPITRSTSGLPMFDKILGQLSTERIKAFIGDDKLYDRGISIALTLSDTQYRLDKKRITLSTTGTEFIASVDIDSEGTIYNGLCTCSTTGNCQHLAATLYQFLKDHTSFISSTPHAYQLIQQATKSSGDSDSSSVKKRSFDEQDYSTDSSQTKKYKAAVARAIITANQGSIAQDAIVIHSSNSESLNNSISSNSLPSVPSHTYCSASSRSLESTSSKFLSSGSLGSSGSNPIVDHTLSLGYVADDEDASLRMTRITEEATIDISSLDTPLQTYKTAEAPTQAIHYDDDAATQIYNYDEEEEEEQHQQQSARSLDVAATQIYNYDEEETQPYDTAATQIYNYDEEEGDTQPNDDIAATQIYNYDEEDEENNLHAGPDSKPVEASSPNNNEMNAETPNNNANAETLNIKDSSNIQNGTAILLDDSDNDEEQKDTPKDTFLSNQPPILLDSSDNELPDNLNELTNNRDRHESDNQGETARELNVSLQYDDDSDSDPNQYSGSAEWLSDLI